MNDAGRTLLLFQLADSALPTGGFAFSHGLEAATAMGWVSSPETFESYLRAQLDQAGEFDLPFFDSFHGAASPWDETSLARILEAYHAAMTLPATRKASLVQGRGLLRLIPSLFDAATCDPVRRFFQHPDHAPHHLAVMATALAGAELQLEPARLLHLFSLARTSTSAAVRLGIIGPTEGARIHASLHDHCTHVAQRVAYRTWQTAARVNPLAEVAQGLHHRIYSRLFQN